MLPARALAMSDRNSKSPPSPPSRPHAEPSAGPAPAGDGDARDVHNAPTTPAPPSPTQRAAGEIVAKRYRLDEELGRGGMGVVWAATHVVTRRRVAIKFLRAPTDLRTDHRARFLREARAASAVDHPNVVSVVDVFELDDETPVIVMELLVGETLRQRLTRVGRLPVGQAAATILRVASAVDRAHALGIVHRDLKPENIFLMRSGAGDAVKVLDFGIAKLLAREGDEKESDSLTGTGALLGTPSYMAPEQVLGEKDIDHRADIWALGVILYECLAGVRPLRGSGLGQVATTLATEGVAPLAKAQPDLPSEMTELVMGMLERPRERRPQTLQSVQEVLSRFAGELEFTATVISPRYPNPTSDSARRELPRAPDVDTDAAKAVTQGSRRAPARPILAVIMGGVLVVVAFLSWKLGSTPPAPTLTTRAPSASATGGSPPLDSAPAPPVATAVVGPFATSPPAKQRAAPESTVTAAADAAAAQTTPPAPTRAHPKSTSGVPSASGAPSAKPAPGGLAEQPPF
jgi:eukaryotic-like serine/threonine-protein kinase